MEGNQQYEGHRNKCRQKKKCQELRLKVLRKKNKETECQGVWNVVTKDKRAMRQCCERVGNGWVREDFAGLEVWIES